MYDLKNTRKNNNEAVEDAVVGVSQGVAVRIDDGGDVEALVEVIDVPGFGGGAAGQGVMGTGCVAPR